MRQIKNKQELDLAIRELELKSVRLSMDMENSVNALKRDYLTLKKLGEMATEEKDATQEEQNKILDFLITAGKLLL